jgi:hypothetical protein
MRPFFPLLFGNTIQPTENKTTTAEIIKQLTNILYKPQKPDQPSGDGNRGAPEMTAETKNDTQNPDVTGAEPVATTHPDR